MHMSDALLSAPVAIIGDIAAAGLISVAAYRIRKSHTHVNAALMGVLGAFVFAAQMINFTIPGTGSSGHIVGGVLLASLLGAWPAFLTLTSVIIIQALLFADGGILALGWNIINMAGMTCLVAYPLIMQPFLRRYRSRYIETDSVSKRPVVGMIFFTIITCLIGLELGAFCVTLETLSSGITSLPFGKFLLFMISIHALIGIGEGVATAAILVFIFRYKPEILMQREVEKESSGRSYKKLIWTFAILALVVGGVLSWFASSNPDGLEWSIEKTEVAEAEKEQPRINIITENFQNITSIFPDYQVNNTDESSPVSSERAQTSIAGVSGAIFVLILTVIITLIINRKKKKQSARQN